MLPETGATGWQIFMHYFPGWYVIKGQPLGFLIFFISVLAETNRVPFDLPDREALNRWFARELP